MSTPSFKKRSTRLFNLHSPMTRTATTVCIALILLLSPCCPIRCDAVRIKDLLPGQEPADVWDLEQNPSDEVIAEDSSVQQDNGRKKKKLEDILDFFEGETLSSEKEEGTIVGQAAALSTYVPPTLNSIFTNNMVLQRDDNVTVYGSASPRMVVTVEFGNIQAKSATADSNGKWLVILDAMPASYKPQSLTVSDGIQTATISNVLVGDVWLCSGQSNMDRPFWNYHSLDISDKNNPFVRLVQVKRGGPKTPSDTLTLTSELGASWQESTSDYLTHFSPAAYFFGEKMEATNHVPMGLLHVAKGATAIEEWMAAEALKKVGVDPEEQDIFTRNYNGMIYPLRNFTFKGILWYQGECNSHLPLKYQQSFPVMIQTWRDLFGRGDIPFYFAQLSSHGTSGWDVTDTAWGYQREAQHRALALPNTRMIVLTDVGEYTSMHPENKMAVGERFARHALQAEGHEGINTDSPTFSSMEIKGEKIVITFDRVGGGLETRQVKMNFNQHLAQGEDPDALEVPAHELRGFAVCGPNKIFVEANATITASNQVTVWSDYITSPVAVRYCFKWFGLCNLYASNDGWVATPFRTDSFPVPLSFRGESVGVLFDGDMTTLGIPMELDIGAGQSTISPVTIDSVDGYQAVSSDSSPREMFFNSSDPEFQSILRPYVIVSFLYYDKGETTDEIRFHYAHLNWSKVFGPLRIKIRNTLEWRVATAVLHDANFSQQYMHSDLRIQSVTNDMIIGGVYLRGPPTV